MTQYKKCIWTLLLGIFIFQGILERVIPCFKVFDECIALSFVPLALGEYANMKAKKAVRLSKTRRIEFGLLTAFVLCGLTGSMINKFQPLWVVCASAVLAAKFFLILFSAGYIQKYLQILISLWSIGYSPSAFTR